MVAVPPITLQQATNGQLGSSYITTLSLTSPRDGVGGQRHAPAVLPPGKRPVPIVLRGWVGPSASLDVCEKPRLPTGFDPRTVQLVASHYTD
jgi:hypothetical protein